MTRTRCIRNHYSKDKADILTKLHVMTIIAGEQQTMNFYMNVGNRSDLAIGRGLYLEIAQIEEQHVSHYESLADPRETWFERLLLHEYNECYLYYSFLLEESDERIKNIWQHHLDCEVEHLHMAAELLQQYEGRDAESLLPSRFPTLTKFESNKNYVREIEATHQSNQGLGVPPGRAAPLWGGAQCRVGVPSHRRDGSPWFL